MRMTDEQFKQELFDRCKKAEAARKKRRKITVTVCACLCLVGLVSAFALRNVYISDAPENNNNAIYESNKQNTLKLSGGTDNLMEDVNEGYHNAIYCEYDYEKFNSFAIGLLKHNLKDNKNIILSPASAAFALGMTANGAQGKTNEEMLNLFEADTNEELNQALYQFSESADKDNSGVKIANSLWINKNTGFEASKEFLRTNADFYSADVFSALFDEATVKDINKWVSRGTDGRIDELVKELDKSTVMCLINTVLFDAEWSEPFDENLSNDGEFNNADGTVSTVKMMNSLDETYVSDDNTKGFIKDYKNGYSFVALLPNEDKSIEEYLSELTPEKLSGLLSQMDSGNTASVTLPAFKSNSEIKLNESLQKMGMKAAFDSTSADFSKMGASQNGSLYVDTVTQNAEIAVDELGTKASAATEVIMMEGAVLVENTVICDRPFIYFIIDTQTHMPLFTGAYMTAK